MPGRVDGPYDRAYREAWRRIFEMAREGLSAMRKMGVKSLSYETDLVPGCESLRLTAEYPGQVRIEADHRWTAGPQELAIPREFVLPEALLYFEDETAPSAASGVLPRRPAGGAE